MTAVEAASDRPLAIQQHSNAFKKGAPVALLLNQID